MSVHKDIRDGAIACVWQLSAQSLAANAFLSLCTGSWPQPRSPVLQRSAPLRQSLLPWTVRTGFWPWGRHAQSVARVRSLVLRATAPAAPGCFFLQGTATFRLGKKAHEPPLATGCPVHQLLAPQRNHVQVGWRSECLRLSHRWPRLVRRSLPKPPFRTHMVKRKPRKVALQFSQPHEKKIRETSPEKLQGGSPGPWWLLSFPNLYCHQSRQVGAGCYLCEGCSLAKKMLVNTGCSHRIFTCLGINSSIVATMPGQIGGPAL